MIWVGHKVWGTVARSTYGKRVRVSGKVSVSGLLTEILPL